MSDVEKVLQLIAGLDGDWHDGIEEHVSVEAGGVGSTSGSCWVTLQNGEGGPRRRLLVRVDLDEEPDACRRCGGSGLLNDAPHDAPYVCETCDGMGARA